MKIFAWRTDVISGYRGGTIAVAAPDVELARRIILADFDRWIRGGWAVGNAPEEHSPMAFTFDGLKPGEDFPDWFDKDEEQETLELIEKYRGLITADISGEPLDLPSDVFYIWHGD